MGSPDNLLIRLPQQQEDYVREVFDQLAAEGLPKQHQRPHITIIFSPNMAPQVVDRARDLLPGLIPTEFQRVGTVVFGTKSKQTIAWLLEAEDPLGEAARELSALNPDGRGSWWIPHITVGLRIPRLQVPEYMAALDRVTSGHFRSITGEVAGLWQPRFQKWTPIAGSPAD